MSLLTQDFRTILLDGLQRRTLSKCSKWAEKCRIVGIPFPGPYSFKHYPWAREMHDEESEEWCGQKGSQLGFTEVGLNRALFTIDIRKTDVLYVLPSQNPHASEFTAGRFDPALQLSPYLDKLFGDVRNVGHKRAGAVNLYIRGSRSPASLKSIPAGLLILDELDEMNQGNLALADERQTGQRKRQKISISTPTIENVGINALYQRSTQAIFVFKCPGCSKFIDLKWPDNFVLCGEAEYDPKIDESYIKCNYCDKKLDHESKHEYLVTGQWQDQISNRLLRGFHINQLYSPTETPGRIAKVWFKAQYSLTEMQMFHNNKLGVVFEIPDSRISISDINYCIGEYHNKPKIQQGTLVTMGIDQGKDLHYWIDAWYPIPNANGDIHSIYRAKLLEYGITGDFDYLDHLMEKWQVAFAVGDHLPQTRSMQEVANRWPNRFCTCLYADSQKARTMVFNSIENRVTVDRTAWLDLALGRFKARSIKIPMDFPEFAKKHINAPIRKPEKDRHGNDTARYITGERVADHFAHARNYSEVALGMFQGHYEHETTDSPR